MDEKIGFPREVKMERAGIFYTEEGPNAVWLNIVIKEGMVKLIVSIDQSDVGNSFTAMTFGRVIESIPLAEALESAKAIEMQAPKEEDYGD